MPRPRPTGHPFTAAFSSLCDYCGSHINAGEKVALVLDNRYICAACVRAGVEN